MDNLSRTESLLDLVKPDRDKSYTGQAVMGIVYLFGYVIKKLVVEPVSYLVSTSTADSSQDTRGHKVSTADLAERTVTKHMATSAPVESVGDDSPVNSFEGQEPLTAVPDSDCRVDIASQDPEAGLRIVTANQLAECTPLAPSDSESENSSDEFEQSGRYLSSDMGLSGLMKSSTSATKLTLAMRQIRGSHQSSAESSAHADRDQRNGGRSLALATIKRANTLHQAQAPVFASAVSRKMSMTLAAHNLADTPEAMTVSAPVKTALQQGLQVTRYQDMSKALGAYMVAVGHFVRDCNQTVSPVQQRILRSGLVDLLAHYSMLENDQEEVEKQLLGIRGGKRAMALKVRKLQQVREALLNHNWQSATQISGIVTQAAFMATTMDMVDCTSQKELMQLVLATGMNVNMFSVSGKENDITEARERVERKQKALTEAFTAAEVSSEKLIELQNALEKSKQHLAARQRELVENLTEIKKQEACHLDQLFLLSFTQQERLRREALPQAFRTLVKETRGRANKMKYYRPHEVVDRARPLLRQAAEIKVRGHQTVENVIYSPEVLEQKVTAECDNAARVVWCGYNEMLLNMLGVEAFCKLNHVAAMSDQERGLLRDHLMRNCPVNIPLAHKEKLFQVARDCAVIGQGPCGQADFVHDLGLAISPYRADMMTALALNEPETFVRVLSAVEPDKLTAEELEANYRGCQALFLNSGIKVELSKGTLGQFKVTPEQVLPNIASEMFQLAGAEVKHNLKNMRSDGETGTDQTPDHITRIPFSKYKDFDFSDPKMQLLMAMSYGYYTMTGAEFALMGGALSITEQVMKDKAVRDKAKDVLVGVGQELLIAGQPEFIQGRYYQHLLFGSPAVPGQCLVNTDNFQPRQDWFIQAQLKRGAGSS